MQSRDIFLKFKIKVLINNNISLILPSGGGKLPNRIETSGARPNLKQVFDILKL